MPLVCNDAYMIPLRPGSAVSRGWTAATGGRPVGVTWHWTATADLALCRRLLGGDAAERRGEASAHYAVGRSRAEGVDRYVALENRSWHAGVNQTYRWDGRALGSPTFKAARTTIGVETVNIGDAHRPAPSSDGWILAAPPDGRHVMQVRPWPAEQIELMIEVGREIVERWPNIRPDDHHGHLDLCPGYKVDPAGFPFAAVLRGIYDDPTIPDVWTPLWLPEQRQRVLRALGCDLGRGGVDGLWGRASDAALRSFQRDQAMPVDGMWTSFTSRRVHEMLAGRDEDVARVAGERLPWRR